MKNLKFFSLASALLLASSAGFTSCSSDSDVSGNNSGGGVAGQVVKTQFAINIPYAKGSENANTRMTEENTQGEGKGQTFRGIGNLRLFTFSSTTYDNATDNIYIGNGENATSIGGASDWRSVYSDVAVSIGTTNLALYGIAENKQNQGADKIGKLIFPTNFSDTKSTSELSFSLDPIYTGTAFGTSSSEETPSAKIIKALNTIVNSEVSYGEGDNEKKVKWSEIADNTDYSTQNERTALTGLLVRFTKLTAGSAESCKNAINGLIAELGSPTEQQKLRSAIKGNCEDALKLLDGNTFPRDLNLPDGVACINYANGAFTYQDQVTMAGNNKINYMKITYPAALTYFVESPVKATNTVASNVTSFPSFENWSDASKNTEDIWTAAGFTDNAVKESTRTIALKNPLRYGVANLKLSVVCASDKLEDNAVSQANQPAANSIEVKTEGFPVTAVLVGGQPKSVSWNYEPSKDVKVEDFSYTIYDSNMNGTEEMPFAAKHETTPSTFNYTLVLDNGIKNESGEEKAIADQQDVYVTIELTNNSGTAFYGADGLIPAGGKFYLVGKLDKTKFSDADGKRHAFTKDYTTIVNLNITNLKSAYNCIPDLRSAQISLGLAVVLDWQTGITFNIDI